MFSPKPNIPYKLVFDLESIMITFTEENNIYPVERCFGFTPYEGYDEDGYRFVCYVCYMDNYVVLHSCVSLKFLNSEADATGEINSFEITKIYL
jgi:hypothetical protein